MISHYKNALAVGVFAAGFMISAPFAAATEYPLAIENCGSTLHFDAAPERVVSLGQSTTEILYSLGLADKVKGTGVWFGPVMDEFRDVNASVPRLADNDPGFETVVAQKPQLVATQYQWHVGPKGIVGTTEQFNELSIPVYTAPADCVGKDNAGGGDGVRHDRFSMDLIYREISDLAQIFDIEDRGAALIARLKDREARSLAQVNASGNSNVSTVFWFSSAEIKSDPYVAGKNGAAGYIAEKLGVTNIIDSDEEWPTVGWETIARANPDIIVIGKMGRRRFPADDWEVKMDFLKTDPVTRQMKAVKNGNIVVMDAQSMDPTIRLIDGIETLAQAVDRLSATN